MNYERWKDADGRYHDISDMPTSYIKACIKEVKRAIKSYQLYSENPYDKTDNPDDNDVLGRNWSIDHAIPFLKAFEDELERRGE